MDDHAGVKESTLNRNVKQMKAITKLFRQTTESLMGECLKTFKYDSEREGESGREGGRETDRQREKNYMYILAFKIIFISQVTETGNHLVNCHLN